MKKTLIAIATFAVTGAAFAQVTLSGNIGFGLQKGADSAASSHGVTQTTGDVNLASKEDLGGGFAVSAQTSLDVETRGTGVVVQDVLISLSTPSVITTLGSIRSRTPLYNVSGAPINLPTDISTGTKVALDEDKNVDGLIFALPLGDFTVALKWVEIATVGAPDAAATAYVGAATYKKGPAVVNVEYASFQGAGAAAGTNTDGLTRTRVWGTYDLGMAKLGLGLQTKNHSVANQASVSLTVPVSSVVTVGLNYSQRDAQAVVANPNGGTAWTATALAARSASAIGIDYALSKTTILNASAGTYDGNADMSNEYRISLTKSF